MLYWETPSDGAVFATGSITFCESFPMDEFDNDISRLLDNLLSRWLGG